MWDPARCQAARLNSHQAAKASPGKEPSDAGEGAASPRRAKPGSRREPTRVGSGPAPAGAAEARQAARGSPCKGRTAKGGRNHTLPAAGGTQAPRPSRAGPTPRAESGCRRGDCSTRSGSAHIARNNANNIANVRRRSTVISHEYESSLNIPRRVHHDERMLSANSGPRAPWSKLVGKLTCLIGKLIFPGKICTSRGTGANQASEAGCKIKPVNRTGHCEWCPVQLTEQAAD